MIIQSFLTIQNQIKILHWQTSRYAEHKALGKAYDSLSILIDSFIETFAGSDRKILELDSCVTKCKSINSIDTMDFMKSVSEFLSTKLNSYIPEGRSDLHNIKDEMIAVVNKTMYLLRLD
jgi:hypothetical protein